MSVRVVVKVYRRGIVDLYLKITALLCNGPAHFVNQ